MRAENLRHAATAVLVRNSAGQVYVHRRTESKDVFPGLLDFTAGGVVGAGEDPAEAAKRELDEELGIRGVALKFLGAADYADDHTDVRAFLFTVTWDGPIAWQPEEVAWGEWHNAADLERNVAERPQDFVPDAVALWADRWPAL
jgi:8-oxo-dGTP pyrophosphatase MutT (NUDIX family)